MARRALFALFLATAAVPCAQAQSVDWSQVMQPAASRLAGMVAGKPDGIVRIGIVAIRPVGLASLEPDLPTQWTDGLATALIAALRPANREFEVLEGQDLNRWLAQQGFDSTGAQQPGAALHAGALMNADYVLVGTVSRAKSGGALADRQLDVDLLDVRAGKSLGTASVNLAQVTTGPAAPVGLAKPPSGWTTRRTIVISGLVATLAAGGIALSKELQLRASIRHLNSLSPNETTEWQASMARAVSQVKDRNFWESVTIGLGGVTAGYLITAGSASVKPIAPPVVLKVPGSRRWSMGLDPAGRRLMFIGSF